MNLTNTPNINVNSNNLQNGTINSNTPTNLAGTLNVTQGLEKGQVIQGEIIDLKNNEISLTLDDGRLITGKLTNPSSHSIGDKVRLSVVDVSLKSLSLKMLETSYVGVPLNTIDKALDAAFLSKNDRNRTIIKELLNNKMSIDKISIQKLIQQSITFKNTNINTLVLMNRYNIPVTNSNIEQFNKYMNMEQNMLSDLNQLSDSIINTLHDNSITLSNPRLNLTNISVSNLMNTNMRLLDFIATDNTMIHTDLSINTLFTKDELSIINSFLQGKNELHSNDEFSSINHMQSMVKEIQAKVLTNSEDSKILSSLTEKLKQIQENNSNPLEKSIKSAQNNTFHNDFSNTKSSDNTTLQFLNNNELESLSNSLKGFSFSTTIMDSIKSGELNANTLLTMVKDNLDNVSSETLKETFANNEFKSLLKELLMNKLTITPEDLKEKKSVQEHMEFLLRSTENLKDLLKDIPANTTANLTNQSQHLQNNLNFINHLNQLFQFVPLPLKLQNQNANGELYIYSKKGSNGSLSEGIKVLLHLDMDNLGRTDIHIEMKENQIQTKFYFEEEEIKHLVSNHIEELTDQLLEKGYFMKSEIFIREADMNATKDNNPNFDRNPFKDRIGDDDNVLINRYNFDLRA